MNRGFKSICSSTGPGVSGAGSSGAGVEGAILLAFMVDFDASILSALIKPSNLARHAGVCLPLTFSHARHDGDGPYLIMRSSVMYSCLSPDQASRGNSEKGTSMGCMSSGDGSENKVNARSAAALSGNTGEPSGT